MANSLLMHINGGFQSQVCKVYRLNIPTNWWLDLFFSLQVNAADQYVKDQQENSYRLFEAAAHYFIVPRWRKTSILLTSQ